MGGRRLGVGPLSSPAFLLRMFTSWHQFFGMPQEERPIALPKASKIMSQTPMSNVDIINWILNNSPGTTTILPPSTDALLFYFNSTYNMVLGLSCSHIFILKYVICATQCFLTKNICFEYKLWVERRIRALFHLASNNPTGCVVYNWKVEKGQMKSVLKAHIVINI